MLLDLVLVIAHIFFNELITEKPQMGMCSINVYVCMYVMAKVNFETIENQSEALSSSEFPSVVAKITFHKGRN